MAFAIPNHNWQKWNKKTWLLQMDHTPVVVQDTTASMITKNVHITGCHQKAKHLTTTAAQLAKVWNGKWSKSTCCCIWTAAKTVKLNLIGTSHYKRYVIILRTWMLTAKKWEQISRIFGIDTKYVTSVLADYSEGPLFHGSTGVRVKVQRCTEYLIGIRISLNNSN